MTEAELVGVSDALTKILWCRQFMEGQGCTVEDVYVYQDNQRTRHVKINYFFITDKVKNNEVKIIYCPTKEMVADFYTKPLQGTLFKEHRDAILGINEDNIILYLEQYAQYIKSMDID